MEPPAFQVEPWLQVLPAEAAHAEALADLVGRNIEHLGRYLPPVAEIHTPEAARAHLADVAGKMARGELRQWHLFADGVLCGVLRLNYFEPLNRKAALSYYLGAEHQGRGIVTRAARAVLGYAFGELHLHRIELRCDTPEPGQHEGRRAARLHPRRRAPGGRDPLGASRQSVCLWSAAPRVSGTIVAWQAGLSRPAGWIIRPGRLSPTPRAAPLPTAAAILP